jgi:hypothetical protein
MDLSVRNTLTPPIHFTSGQGNRIHWWRPSWSWSGSSHQKQELT